MYSQDVACIFECLAIVFHLQVPFASILIPARSLYSVAQLDVLISMILVAGVFNVLLNLIASRVEVFPVGLELEGVGVAVTKSAKILQKHTRLCAYR